MVALVDSWISGLVRSVLALWRYSSISAPSRASACCCGFGFGLGFPFDPCSVFAAGLPFGFLCGDALRGLVCPG